MLIRRENPADLPAVSAVIAEAFGTGVAAPAEVALADQLRADGHTLPNLCMVAVDADRAVVGQVLCSRGRVDRAPVVALGPIAVRPDRQGRGTGTALVHAALGAADALGEPLVGLLGDPRYYGRFGFSPGADYGILAPDPAWGAHFQVRVLTAYADGPRGRFRYAEPFERL